MTRTESEGVAGIILAIIFTLYMMSCDSIIISGPETIETIKPNETIYYVYHGLEEGEQGAYFYIYSITSDSLMWTGTTEIYEKGGIKVASYSDTYTPNTFPLHLDNSILTAYLSVTYY